MNLSCFSSLTLLILCRVISYSNLSLISEGRDPLELEAEAILRRLEAEEEATRARKEYLNQLEEQKLYR